MIKLQFVAAFCVKCACNDLIIELFLRGKKIIVNDIGLTYRIDKEPQV